MKDSLPRYTMRINADLLNKLHYVAEYDSRTVNKQLEMLVKKCVADFEEKHGEITEKMIEELYSGKTGK